MSNFITDTLEICKGNFHDYEKLKEYHYIQTDPVAIHDVYKVKARDGFQGQFPDPIAVVVYMAPIRDLTTRNKATDNYFKKYSKIAERYSAVNRNIVYLARVIVDPRFHRRGIAFWLVSETLKLQKYPLVETMTPIDKVLPLFRKAGFELHFQPTPTHYSDLLSVFERCQILPEIHRQPEIVQIRLDSLNHHKKAEINKAMKTFAKKFYHHENDRPGIELTKFVLSRIEYPNAYLLWRNPAVQFPVP